MPSLSKNIKTLMAELNLSTSKLAKRTGIKQPVLHRIVSGETKNPSVLSLSPIAKFFSVSISQLIGDKPLPENREAGTYLPNKSTFLKVPIISWNDASKWPERKSKVQPEKTIPVDLDIHDDSFALTVHGTTFLPKFTEGTILVIDPHMEPVDRNYTIITDTSDMSVSMKQVFIDGKNVYLKPLNPDIGASAIQPNQKFSGVIVAALMSLSRCNINNP